jgi:rod shape-determining protein MreC
MTLPVTNASSTGDAKAAEALPAVKPDAEILLTQEPAALAPQATEPSTATRHPVRKKP